MDANHDPAPTPLVIDAALLARLRQLKTTGDARLAAVDLDALAAGTLNPQEIIEAVIAILAIFFSGNAFVAEVITLLTDLEPIFSGGSGTIPAVRLDQVKLGPTPYGPWKAGDVGAAADTPATAPAPSKPLW
jgi:hypothetical protein